MRVIDSSVATLLGALCALGAARSAQAAPKPTPGYQERIFHWTIQKGETCRLIAHALYGSEKHAALLKRYNNIDCNKPLTEGLTLVVPETVGTVPTAQLRSMAPKVKARPPGSGWAPASPGMPLYENHSVNTLNDARANIVFADRTRVYLAENTLVVIYDTAAVTRVSKTPPPKVELETGEVQAGLAALRGQPVEIAVKGGARVSANSKEASVRKKGKRSTVSVFDGKAKVRSAGKSVTVPEKFGSAFVEKQAPKPPRPLPPAPKYGPDSSSGIVVTEKGKSRIFISWTEVPRAVAYRVELARDSSFSDLVVREEVTAKVRAFRAEKLPQGSYHVRVRAIDDEDFLGIASSRRDVTLVVGSLSGGRIIDGRIQASPYARLVFAPDSSLQLAVDDADFGPLPEQIDLLQLAPKSLSLRSRGSQNVQRVNIDYRKPRTEITWANVTARRVRVRLSGLDGVDIPTRVAPKLLSGAPGRGAQEVPLLPGEAKGEFFATLSEASLGDVELDLVDGRGRVLGSETLVADAPPSSPDRPDSKPPPLGLVAPPVVPSPALSISWWAPSAFGSGAVGATVSHQDSGRFQGHARAQGAVGDLGADALVLSDGSGDARQPDQAAWLGLRWRAVRTDSGLELSPAARVGVPTSPSGTPTRAELAVALGMRSNQLGVIINAGGRAALDETDQTTLPEAQGFLLGGGTWDFQSWLTGYAVLDAHVLARDSEAQPRGGLSLGLEAGNSFVASLGMRASPWEEDGGHFMGQLGIGVRERLP